MGRQTHLRISGIDHFNNNTIEAFPISGRAFLFVSPRNQLQQSTDQFYNQQYEIHNQNNNEIIPGTHSVMAGLFCILQKALRYERGAFFYSISNTI